ncbi:MAG: hypothetical protein WA285_21730 [Mycobacterium sp.]
MDPEILAILGSIGQGAPVGDVDVSPYAAPSRATALCGLPDAYIDVGVLDILRARTSNLHAG